MDHDAIDRAPESVITSSSLAGFGSHRPQPLGGRTAIPPLSGTRLRFPDGHG